MIRRIFTIFVACVVMAGLMVTTSSASRARPILVAINISSQSMRVTVDGETFGNWKVSTARPGYYTPRGTYRVQRMARVYYSKKYDNAPMPNAVFFKGGYAIHGTNMLRSLGRPASHGCIRLHPANARALFDLVREYGPGAVTVSIAD